MRRMNEKEKAAFFFLSFPTRSLACRAARGSSSVNQPALQPGAPHSLEVVPTVRSFGSSRDQNRRQSRNACQGGWLLIEPGLVGLT